MRKFTPVTEGPIPVLLRRIYNDGLSGTIFLKGENWEKSVFFSRGAILFAKTSVIQERLGEVLFKTGKISRQQFWNIHKMIEGRDARIGRILVENKILTEKEIYSGIQHQIKSIALSLFFTDSGQWYFDETEPEIPSDSKFNIDLSKIILEGATGYIQNINFYKNIHFAKSPVINIISSGLAGILPENLIHFHSMLNGYSGRSNEEIAKEMNIPEIEYWRQILPLYLLGGLDFGVIKIREEERRNIDNMLQLFEKIRSEKANFYEVLGLSTGAAAEDIRNSYFELAKKYHPDRITTAPDPEIKEKANFVFSEINRAYDTLSDTEKRDQYDGNIIKNRRKESDSADGSVERASLLYRKAKTLFNQRNFWEATTLLEEAIRLNPKKGAYFLLLGLSQMSIPSMIRAAEKNLSQSALLDPWSPEPLTALGLLFLNENMKNRSESFFRRAISLDPENALAKKKLGELGVNSSKNILKSSFFKKKN